MINYTPTPDFYNDYICHYNHNHDPKNGQFAKGFGGSTTGAKQASHKKLNNKQIKRMQKDADDFGQAFARIEDAQRQLPRTNKPGQQILVDSDTKKRFDKLYVDFRNKYDKLLEKYDDVTIDIINDEKDGKDYAYVLIGNKGTDYYNEWKAELKNQNRR